MAEYDKIRSGFGGEKGDVVVVNHTSKPVWRLKPLPLSQVNPAHAACSTRIGPPPSLQTSCLDTISACFHEYPPDALHGLPPQHIQRVLAKVRSDRWAGDNSETCRPDEATLWAYSVLADPEGTERDMTLGLHPQTTLRQLVPNPSLDPPDHPFVQLPKLYASLQPESPFALLTTISFDGADMWLKDDTFMAMRYTTNLTVLSMRTCSGVTDNAIRLLASALILPGDRGGDGQGMWRLRAWTLSGCRGISDRSMRSLARWPGLVAIDLRDTSCTSAALQVYNKSSQDLFTCQLADMQPVNASLRQLFSTTASPAAILAGLNATLLGPTSHGLTAYRALHVIPNYHPLAPEYMPDPPSDSCSSSSKGRANSSVAYRTGGLGQLYGTDVSRISDDTQAFRSNVKTALKMQAMDEGLIAEERPRYMDDTEYEVWKKANKRESRWWKEAKMTKAEERAHKKLMKGYKETDARDQGTATAGGKKAPVVPGSKSRGGKKGKDQADDEVIKGDPDLMLVRVGQEGWDRMTWRTGIFSSTASAPGMALMDSQRAERKANLVGDILGLIQPSRSSSTAKPLVGLQPNVTLLPPSSPATSQADKPVAATPRPANPFAFARSQFGRMATDLGASPHGSGLRLSQPSSSPELGLSNGAQGPQGKKRRFGGVDPTQGEVKRRGMKMFSART